MNTAKQPRMPVFGREVSGGLRAFGGDARDFLSSGGWPGLVRSFCFGSPRPMEPDSALPRSGDLDVGMFARLFDTTSASYKHLLFRSILMLPWKQGGSDVLTEHSGIEIETLANDWHPVDFFRPYLSGDEMDDLKRISEACANSVAPQLSLASERGFQSWR